MLIIYYRKAIASRVRTTLMILEEVAVTKLSFDVCSEISLLCPLLVNMLPHTAGGFSGV